MKHILLISGCPNSLLPAGVEALMKNSGRFESVSILGYDEVGSVDLRPDSLFVLFWEEGSSPSIVGQIKKIRAVYRDAPVLVVDQGDIDVEVISDVARMQKTGFVSNRCTVRELFFCMEKLHAGHLALCPIVQEKLLSSFTKAPEKPDLQKFSEMEKAVIDATCRGQSIRQTAEEMNLSPYTVATYRSRILKKAGVKSMTQFMAKYAVGQKE